MKEMKEIRAMRYDNGELTVTVSNRLFRIYHPSEASLARLERLARYKFKSRYQLSYHLVVETKYTF